MRWTAVVVVLLAGCSAAAPASPGCDEGCAVVDEESTGVVRGVVVDDTIVPVADAKVVLQKGGDILAEAKSSSDGAFAFHGLEEGAYFVTVSKTGFQTTQSYVEAADGRHAARVMLPRVEVPPQMAFTVQWDGLMGCSVRIPGGWAQLCSLLDDVVGPPFGDDSVGRFYEEFTDPGRHPDHLQVEMVWDSTQAAGAALTMMVHSMPESRAYGTRITSVEGTSPIIVPLDRNKTREHAIGAPADDREAHGLLLQIWAGAEDLVGATYQQDFQVFMTAFYGHTPPEGWAFVTHGEP